MSNATSAFADGYGHVPVDTAFELDGKTISAILSIALFFIGAIFVVEGVFFKNASKV
ncbi:hypothetical protein HYV12_00690 [Candidatus Dojkabacteria bacterium]|nr:hypothetical protein [Candidatus Dojkabacteria bacterium]